MRLIRPVIAATASESTWNPFSVTILPKALNTARLLGDRRGFAGRPTKCRLGGLIDRYLDLSPAAVGIIAALVRFQMSLSATRTTGAAEKPLVCRFGRKIDQSKDSVLRANGDLIWNTALFSKILRLDKLAGGMIDVPVATLGFLIILQNN